MSTQDTLHKPDEEPPDGAEFEPPSLPLRDDVVVTPARGADACGAIGCQRDEHLHHVYIGRIDTDKTLCTAHTVDFLHRNGAVR